jgi:short-subunit dehydrogenase
VKVNLKDIYGDWALVAGAAEGLGAAYSRELAASGLNLILVDMQKEHLENLSRELEETFGVICKSLHLDLEADSSNTFMMEAVRATGCRLLVYNAAFSRVQKFLENDPLMLDRYVQVNIRTPLQFIYAFSAWHRGNTEFRKGMVLMSSMAGSWGTRLLGPYGGSKAFIHKLAESLHFELREEGFDVLACIAGPTSTPGYLSSLPPGKEKAMQVMQAEKVVQETLEALGRRAFIIPGLRNRMNYFLMSRILPRTTALKMMNRAVSKLYRNNL